MSKIINTLISEINNLSINADENIIADITELLPDNWKMARIMELYEEECWEIYNQNNIPVIQVTLIETTLKPNGSNINLHVTII